MRLDRTGRLRRGQLFTLYVDGYALGRLWVEALRIDPANAILGLRVNIWTSLAALVIAAAVFVVQSQRAAPAPNLEQIQEQADGTHRNCSRSLSWPNGPGTTTVGGDTLQDAYRRGSRSRRVGTYVETAWIAVEFKKKK